MWLRVGAACLGRVVSGRVLPAWVGWDVRSQAGELTTTPSLTPSPFGRLKNGTPEFSSGLGSRALIPLCPQEPCAQLNVSATNLKFF